MPRRKAGRPKLLDEVIPGSGDPAKTGPRGKKPPDRTRRDIILDALRNGARPITAFGVAGVRYQTGEQILRQGRRAREARKHTWQREFLEAFELARLDARMTMERVVFDAGKRGAKYAIEFLKRTYPDEWGDKVTIEEVREEARQLARAGGDDERAAVAEAERIFAGEVRV